MDVSVIATRLRSLAIPTLSGLSSRRSRNLANSMHRTAACSTTEDKRADARQEWIRTMRPAYIARQVNVVACVCDWLNWENVASRRRAVSLFTKRRPSRLHRIWSEIGMKRMHEALGFHCFGSPICTPLQWWKSGTSTPGEHSGTVAHRMSPSTSAPHQIGELILGNLAI